MSPRSPFYVTLKGRFLRSMIGRKAFTPTGIAAYAKEHTRFYAEHYRGCDVNDFESLPLLTKKIVRDRPPFDLLSKPMEKKVVYYGETTGSTGSPTPSFYTSKEFHGATLLTMISPWFPMLKRTLAENRTCVNGLAFGFTVAGMSFGDLLKNIGGLVANTGSRSTLATPPRIARGIVRLEPSMVAAAPIDFLSWMRIVEEDWPDEAPRVKERLRALVSTAELFASERTRRISEHFEIEAVDTYACVEGFFSLPCPCGEKHVLPAYHAELFDEDLNYIGTEGTGRFAFTNLLKKSSPMVRYLLDDLVTIHPSECPYGFTKSVIPHGRWELTVRINGETVNVEQFENEIFTHGLFGDFHVTVHDEHMDVTVEDYAAPSGAGEAVAAGLEKRFGLRANVEVVPFGTLTDYREPRMSKPILKLTDARAESTQEAPTLL
ncbi:MAG: phenylacetate--CoA ligase family protein [Planctomycetota bacterium]